MFWRAYAYIGMVRVCPERGRGRGSQLRVWILDETRTSSKLGRNEGLPRSRNRGRYRTDSRSSYFIPLYSFIFLYIPLYSFIFTFQPFFFRSFSFLFFSITRGTRDRERPEKLTDRKDNKKRDNKKKERREDGELFLSFICRDFLRENISTRHQQAGTISTRKSTYTDHFPRLQRKYNGCMDLSISAFSIQSKEIGIGKHLQLCCFPFVVVVVVVVSSWFQGGRKNYRCSLGVVSRGCVVERLQATTSLFLVLLRSPPFFQFSD